MLQLSSWDGHQKDVSNKSLIISSRKFVSHLISCSIYKDIESESLRYIINLLIYIIKTRLHRNLCIEEESEISRLRGRRNSFGITQSIKFISSQLREEALENILFTINLSFEKVKGIHFHLIESWEYTEDYRKKSTSKLMVAQSEMASLKLFDACRKRIRIWKGQARVAWDMTRRCCDSP